MVAPQPISLAKRLLLAEMPGKLESSSLGGVLKAVSTSTRVTDVVCTTIARSTRFIALPSLKTWKEREDH